MNPEDVRHSLTYKNFDRPYVPQGHPIIAQRFIAGCVGLEPINLVPQGRLNAILTTKFSLKC